MQYSLLNRFRGALLGSVLGEMKGSQGQDQNRLELSPVRLSEEIATNIEINLQLPWNDIAVSCAQSLIRCGRLDLKDLVRHNYYLLPENMSVSCSEAAIATLPVGLFFHEHEVTLQQKLTIAASTLMPDCGNSLGVLAVGYAIAQALTEKLHPLSLIPQILTYLDDVQTPFTQQLSIVQTELTHGAGLEKVVNQLCRNSNHSTTPIALAFYCFLSTPQDFRLSLLRALRTNYHPQTTAALTGALSGAYNSLLGIPLGWRIACDRNNKLEVIQLAERLLAVWSGVYDTSTTYDSDQVAIAAPRVIQPRLGGY
ncbi:ADP-ribosylation/Crystallin J1 [Crinalium epipsammum PCC 9333]|uniref:ADP-ribosylation/Crystallin J1 n=1 Tax=Crinalium epipsammum PCC 9333 TaxID=1173022 RepID=K9VU89_9CYAN|nr:ADP-ribosylglycohydrolase family protein [Crinalium epipsammum]AFZ11124.1 ADP-ribosylation/Crystallin J1 [Crinalium epipsammum PCC 9333]